MTRALAVGVVCAGLSACVHNTPAKPAQLPVLELTLAQVDGKRVELAAISGKPTLLFLFATYDEASQLALVPLLRFLEQEPHVAVVGIALQPDAKAFVDMYKRALSIPFDLYVDPDNQLLHGDSALGRVQMIPAFIALDSQGRIREVAYGAVTGEQLRLLADDANAR